MFMTYRLLILCCLLCCVMLIATSGLASTLPEYDWAHVITPRTGVSMGFYKTVDSAAFRFGMRSDMMDEVIRSGRAPWARFISENAGVYVVVGVYLEGEVELVLTENSQFVFEYVNGETRDAQEFSSTDILLRKVDLLRNEERLFDAKLSPVVLRDDIDTYDRSEKGGFKLYVRFLSLPHGDRYGYAVPDAVRLMQGGQDNETRN